MNTRTLASTDEMAVFAGELLAGLSPRTDGTATVLALSGDLGAGKTAFVKALAKYLGVEEHITSPTFVIQKTYNLQPTTNNGFKKLIHIDAYRLAGGNELAVLGFKDTLADSKNLIALEWPELVADVVPENAMCITFTHVDENTRSVSHA
ncbi:MAG: tRNA (adenosine(37)-N6)-threonylcarbamoyltransferase complex ATPase subunit type 1 TsaE [Candidatus Pacebacteria bacterium]|nr:tRNA (adenosine(37)-N6)-threonylcarbamoyltransferase complex ATPase subunit type 1 TsaE [Candidatus Paceibacterota bacterium]